MTDVQDETEEAPRQQQLTRVDTPLDRRRVGDMTVEKFAGLTFREYREAVEFSKLIAQARNGIPEYLRNNPGDCLVVCTQALRWNLEPVWCMQHSYITREGSLIAYDAAVHAAIVLSCAPLQGRPRYQYIGEDDTRQCIVSAKFVGETEPHVYTTPPIKQCRPPMGDKGIKGSPLWLKDPDQQLGYYAIRNWGRRHVPELLGGVYDPDELGGGSQKQTDVVPPSPNLMARLPGKIEGAGFAENVVDASLDQAKPHKEPSRRKPKKDEDAPSAAEKSQDAPNPPAATQEPPQQETAPAAKPEPAQAIPDATKTNGMRSPEEYLAYWDEFCAACASVEALSNRWTTDKPLRGKCMVVGDQFVAAKTMRDKAEERLRK